MVESVRASRIANAVWAQENIPSPPDDIGEPSSQRASEASSGCGGNVDPRSPLRNITDGDEVWDRHQHALRTLSQAATGKCFAHL